MVKVWKDLNDLTFAEVPSDLKRFDKVMKSIPNFEKSEGAKKIYQRKEYTIYKVKSGFIIHNTKKQFEKGHTHVKDFSYAKSIIDLCVRKKIPNRPTKWLIESLVRVSLDNKYIEKLEKL